MIKKIKYLVFLFRYVFLVKIPKTYKVYNLEKKNFSKGVVSKKLFSLFDLNITNIDIDDCFNINILGQDYDLKVVNWHKDIVSNFVYEKNRFDKLNYVSLFNKNIDVKNPWELSRFQFFLNFVNLYKVSKDKKYYDDFKRLIYNWCNENPFLYGINWTCTMEVSIRAINWIFASVLFGDVFYNDIKFKNFIKDRLIEHANYIYSFPEKNIKGKSNNHLVSDYCGLFVISRFLDSTVSNMWQNNAVKGLEECMDEQIFYDGCDFECSIPYHRLNLELFMLSAFLDNERDLFSKNFYFKLFRMLEFVECYTDSKGNAPQMGDNDSGIILPFNRLDNQNHLYLLSLGCNIFEYDFIKNKVESTQEVNILPLNQKKVLLSDWKPRTFINCVAFEKGGYYILQNKKYKLVVYAPQKENNGGHRHLDAGNYTLSSNGVPLIVDPGTGNYTSNLSLRKKMRSHFSHNVYYSEIDNAFDNNLFFSKVENDYCESVDIGNDYIRIVVKNNIAHFVRSFYLYENKVVINDIFYSDINNIKGVINLNCNFILDNDTVKIENNNITIEGNTNVKVNNYLYSPVYGKVLELKRIEYLAKSNNSIVIS